MGFAPGIRAAIMEALRGPLGERSAIENVARFAQRRAAGFAHGVDRARDMDWGNIAGNAVLPQAMAAPPAALYLLGSADPNNAPGDNFQSRLGQVGMGMAALGMMGGGPLIVGRLMHKLLEGFRAAGEVIPHSGPRFDYFRDRLASKARAHGFHQEADAVSRVNNLDDLRLIAYPPDNVTPQPMPNALRLQGRQAIT
jgi:hypothetical protein